MMRTLLLTMPMALAAAAPCAAQAPGPASFHHATMTAQEPEGTRDAVARAHRAEQRPVARGQREKAPDDRLVEQTETITATVRIGPQGEIELHNLSGSVTVTRGGASEATIEAVKKARGASEEAAREMLARVDIDIRERGNRIDVSTRYPHHEGHPGPGRRAHRRMNVSVSYSITAPAETRVRVNAMSGDITIRGITGELALEAMSGDITVEGAARVATAKTMSGDVMITDVTGDGVVDAGSMSGSVALKQVKARRINAGVISGTISLVDVDAPRVDAQTTSGNLTYQGTLAKSGRYRLGSHSGNLKVMVAGDTGFELEANSWGGRVSSDIELQNQHGRDVRLGSPSVQSRTLRGIYGDGSAVLDLTTFSGTIVVGRQDARKR